MNRFNILIGIIISIMIIILSRLFFIQVLNNKIYLNKKTELTEKILFSPTAPRGRIYDRNGILLVDNKPNKVIYYNKNSDVSRKEELEIVKKLSVMLDIDYNKVTIKNLKDYYLVTTDVDLITEKEKEDYKNRILTAKEILDLKYSRITEKDLENLNKEEAYIYYLMHNGYSYSDKNIKDKSVTDYEYALIAENLEFLPGVGVKLDWEREYLYENTFKSIFGKVGEIPIENIDYYLELGYSKDDVVGTSYLEYQYDSYLKGTKNKYVLKSSGDYELLEEGKKGSDLYLSIDINLQQQIDDIIINNIKQAKREVNTTYLNKAFVVISNPQNGEIYAMSGKQVVNDEIYDYTPGIITTSYVVGSTVKGASHIVGYNTGSLNIGEIRDDSCIKIKSTNEKCSWKYLGMINDLDALKYSSNTYQFITAIKVGKGNYYYNAPLKLSDDSLEIYRNTFNEFGLGVLTNIDLPNEKIGYIGKANNSNLLLNFSIGQYDTYTPIELSQYINTIANGGTRIKPTLVTRIVSPSNEELYKSEVTKLNIVNTKIEYINRVKEGFRQVLELYGTGYNYINPIYMPAGKTGTSQSFIDTDLDGVVDTETITTTFAGYAPYNNPYFSIIVITPDISDYSTSEYVSGITKNIVRQASDAFFQRY